MATSRYSKLLPVNNVDEGYKKLYLYSRVNNNNIIRQYPTLNLKYPTSEQIQSYTIQTETWSLGDRFYKLANQYYGDSQYWWLIAFFNKTPTEQHLQLGDVVQIPLPLNVVLSDLGL